MSRGLDTRTFWGRKGRAGRGPSERKAGGLLARGRPGAWGPPSSPSASTPERGNSGRRLSPGLDPCTPARSCHARWLPRSLQRAGPPHLSQSGTVRSPVEGPRSDPGPRGREVCSAGARFGRRCSSVLGLGKPRSQSLVLRRTDPWGARGRQKLAMVTLDACARLHHAQGSGMRRREFFARSLLHNLGCKRWG